MVQGLALKRILALMSEDQLAYLVIHNNTCGFNWHSGCSLLNRLKSGIMIDGQRIIYYRLSRCLFLTLGTSLVLT